MNNLGKTLSEIFSDKYIIPLYQRNFAWRTDEIQQLLQDVYEAMLKSPSGNYYIGSLVVLKRHNGDFEVIDGQQRLTVISIIAILFKTLSHPVLFYDSRPEVQDFFEVLCNNPDEITRMTSSGLYYLKEACEYIKKAKVKNPRDEKEIELTDAKFNNISLVYFFMNNIVLIRNEIPEDTDVAAYFEIMNNRGEQLQKHEIIKARMMDKIRLDGNSKQYDIGKQNQFAKIWNICSQMEIPLHRLFSANERRRYFGEKYDAFSFASDNQNIGVNLHDGFSIEQILTGNVHIDGSKDESIEEETETEIYTYGSIIDFPNFLMHMIKLYLQTKKIKADIPLNEKDLLSVYDDYGDDIDSMEFIKQLLFCRTVFDRFIVKTTEDTKQEDNRKWILIQPVKYQSNWQFKSSFDGIQGKMLIKALSMLQVTFRNRIYKNWLYEVLSWFYSEYYENGNLSSITAEKYLNFLHGYISQYYDSQNYQLAKVSEEEDPTPENSFSKGTGTPHFLLNLIDYLYCCDNPEIYLDSFDFKYWNSVEHHRAQNKAEDGCTYIDNLGNLCLVSKSSNSRLSDRDVKEKVEVYGSGNLGPNRQVIYKMTRDAQWNWKAEQVRKHYNDIVDLLSKRQQLLEGILRGANAETQPLTPEGLMVESQSC